METICKSPKMAGDLGVFDCAGVADGSAAAIVVRAEDAHQYTDKPIFVKALSFVAGNGGGVTDPTYDYTHFPEIAATARATRTRRPASPTRATSSRMAEVHDCFTLTELVLMEDLGFSERGAAWRDELDGVFDLDGELPVNPDGGLKSLRPPGRRVRAAHDVRGVAAAARARRPPSGRSRRPSPAATAASRSPTTSAATPARW